MKHLFFSLLFLTLSSLGFSQTAVALAISSPPELKEQISSAVKDLLSQRGYTLATTGKELQYGVLQISALKSGETVAITASLSLATDTTDIQAALRASQNAGLAQWVKQQNLYTAPQTKLYLSSASQSDIMRVCRDFTHSLFPNQ